MRIEWPRPRAVMAPDANSNLRRETVSTQDRVSRHGSYETRHRYRRSVGDCPHRPGRAIEPRPDRGGRGAEANGISSQERAKLDERQQPQSDPDEGQQQGAFQNERAIVTNECPEAAPGRDHESSRISTRPLAAISPRSARMSCSHRTGSTSYSETTASRMADTVAGSCSSCHTRIPTSSRE